MTQHRLSGFVAWFLVSGCAAIVVGGCASSPSVNLRERSSTSALVRTSATPDPIDPWERFNRDVTQFNDGADELLLKPLAAAYVRHTPSIVRTSVGNFFFNLSSIPSAVNHLLQGKIQAAAEGAIRVGVNTVFGFGGLIDIASEMNIERHQADLGQTLGRWGVPTGPYLVVPFLGPTTLRDAIAGVVVSKDEVILHINKVPIRNALYGLRSIEKRANLMRATSVMEEAALDRYTFTRDVFLQVRRNEVLGDQEEDIDVPYDADQGSIGNSSVGPQVLPNDAMQAADAAIRPAPVTVVPAPDALKLPGLAVPLPIDPTSQGAQ